MNRLLHLGYGKGWRPDLPDARDLLLATELPLSYETRPKSLNLALKLDMPPILDQGQLGSCTAFGTLRCFDFAYHCETGTFFNGSHLFQYFNSRALENDTNADGGASIRDAMKALSKYGVCPETMWPYAIQRFKRHPTQACYDSGAEHESRKYMRVDRSLIRDAIAAGYPVVFGATLYTSFESPGPTAASGWTLPMPDLSRERVLGGHCMVIVGYDDVLQAYRVANSWGMGWGDKGYYWLPYAYVANRGLTSDFWMLQKTEI